MYFIHIAFIHISLLAILYNQQVDAQSLIGGQNILCDSKASQIEGNPTELDPLPFLDSLGDELIEKIPRCISFFCINDTVQVQLSYLSSTGLSAASLV